jgi:hypothetical protein
VSYDVDFLKPKIPVAGVSNVVKSANTTWAGVGAAPFNSQTAAFSVGGLSIAGDPASNILTVAGCTVGHSYMLTVFGIATGGGYAVTNGEVFWAATGGSTLIAQTYACTNNAPAGAEFVGVYLFVATVVNPTFGPNNLLAIWNSMSGPLYAYAANLT